jgi:hypothetical protein
MLLDMNDEFLEGIHGEDKEESNSNTFPLSSVFAGGAWRYTYLLPEDQRGIYGYWMHSVDSGRSDYLQLEWLTAY